MFCKEIKEHKVNEEWLHIMNIFFRVLLAIYAFCLTILSFITMLITLKSGLFDFFSAMVKERVLVSANARFIMLVIAFIFFALSITFLFSGFRVNKDKKAVSKHTNIGEIKISLDTLENIALAASKKLTGVKESKASVCKVEDGVNIAVKAVMMSDVNIPTLSEDIQVKVKKSVEDSTGIKVNDVKVIVESVYTGYKARVE